MYTVSNEELAKAMVVALTVTEMILGGERE